MYVGQKLLETELHIFLSSEKYLKRNLDLAVGKIVNYSLVFLRSDLHKNLSFQFFCLSFFQLLSLSFLPQLFLFFTLLVF